MSEGIRNQRQYYRSAVRRHGRLTGTDQSANADVGAKMMTAIDAAGIPIRNVNALTRPVIAMMFDDGQVHQNLDTGEITVHGLTVDGRFTDGPHHRGHVAASAAEAIDLLQGPATEQTAIARRLMDSASQTGLQMEALFRDAIDQRTPDDETPRCLADGLLLIDRLKAGGHLIARIGVNGGNIILDLPHGSITQTGGRTYRVSYRLLEHDDRGGLIAKDIPTAEEAIAMYVEQAVPSALAAYEEQRVRREAKAAAVEAERLRQEDVIARYEAMSEAEKENARLAIDYLEVAVARSASFLGVIVASRAGSPSALLDLVARDGMPEFDGRLIRTPAQARQGDVAKAA